VIARFIDICEIISHHCLNFLFTSFYMETETSQNNVLGNQEDKIY